MADQAAIEALAEAAIAEEIGRHEGTYGGSWSSINDAERCFVLAHAIKSELRSRGYDITPLKE